MPTSLDQALASVTSQAVTPAGGAQPKSSGLDERLSAALDNLRTGQESLGKEAESVSEGMKKRQEQRESVDIPKIPELAQPPKPESRDPIQAFGSAAGWLSVFGSILTRQPLTTSLNAAAGVMNAWKQQDATAAKQQFDIWKAQTDNAIKLHDFAREYYKDEMDRLKEGDDSALNGLRAKAVALKDSTVVALADLKDRDGILKHQEQVDKMNLKVQESQVKLIEMQQKQIALAELTKDPAFVAASPKDKARMAAEITNPSVIAAEIKNQAATEAKTQKETAGMDSALSQLEDIKKAVRAGGGMGVTGLAGMAQRVKETVETAVPSGADVLTPASDLESKIDALKLQIPKILTGASKSAADERAKVDTILRGLKPGDTQEKTLHALGELEKTLRDREARSKKEPENMDLQGLSDEEIRKQLGL